MIKKSNDRTEDKFMKKIIDMPDFIFISLIFLALFILTKNSIKLLYIMIFLIFILICLLLLSYIKYLIKGHE